MMHDKKKPGVWRRTQALLLTLCLSLSLCPVLSGTAGAAGESAMDQLISWGVVGGYPDGNAHPERSLTRAEFTAMVNRAYGYTKTGETPFTDVSENAWYYDDIGIAYNANYFNGVSPRMAGPDQTLTRETAMVLLARNMRLDPVGGEVIEFSDGRSFASWSRGYARAAAQMGLIDGYSDGSYRPQNNITRSEMAELLQRALGTLVNRPGTHTLGSVYGNVTVNTPNATLRDATIAGNLYITGGLGLGDVTLENVRVLGDIIVAGGGSSVSGSESVVLRNVTADSLLVDSIADQLVALRAEGNTDIAETLLRSDAYVQDRTRTGLGLRSITLESPDENASFTLSGNLGSVVNKTSNSTLNLGAGTLQTLTVDGSAAETKLDLAANATVKSLNLDAAADVTGTGDIGALRANTGGSTTTMLPDTVTIRDGQTATVAGTEMTPTQAQENSLDPRLLAGYPKVTSLAPTGATAVFSANKPVTVYWALSYTLDMPRGGFTADELITPTAGDTRIRSSGNVSATAAEAEITAALSGLTADVSFTLSAVAVDSRGMRSPVKSVPFKTPDNTAPAFNSTYPKLDNVTSSSALVTAVANKDCRMYYALYRTDANAAAPTNTQLRSGSIAGFVSRGSTDVSKNDPYPINLTGLNDATGYTLYLMLADIDGSRISQVVSVQITTPDSTAPVFSMLPAVVDEADDALTFATMLSEDATVYWTAVKASDSSFPRDFINPNNTATGSAADNRNREYHIRQIMSGTGTISGNFTATANTVTEFEVAGLDPGTSYKLWFVAVDSVGNFSAFSKVSPGQCCVTAMTTGTAPATSSVSPSSAASLGAASDPSPAQASPSTLQTPLRAEPAAPAVITEPEPEPEPTVTLSRTSLSLSTGQSAALTPTVENLEGDYSIIWTTSSPGTAFVDLEGNVTAIGPGTADVKATVRQDGEDVLSATCSVTVDGGGR